MESLEQGFTLASIKGFLAYHGGKVEYHRLVTHFKHSLGSPEARVLFKDYVNELAFVAQEGNAKFLVLRPEYCQVDTKYERRVEFPSEAPHDRHCIPSTSVNRHQVMTRSYSTQESRTSSIFCTATDDSSQPPQPPPRRKSLSSSSFTGSKSAGIEEKLRRLNETSSLKETEPKSPPHQEEKLKEIQELTFKSPGRVKEHAQKLNKMASELELRPPMPASDSQKKNKVKDSHRESKDEDNDTGSLQPLDPLRRKWMVIVSTCDYNEIVQLLKEDPKLAVFKDFTSGYTALHWAAKFGKAEIIKLIAGTHGVDPNVKNFAGQTPLHLAALFGHKDIMELLLQVYGASSNVRDHSGKLPQQYLLEKENVNNVEVRNRQNANGSLNGNQHCRHFGPSSSSSHKKNPQGRPVSDSVHSAFIRIGSLNTKMRRTAAALTGIKSWGSADSLSDDGHKNSMGPPKCSRVKKKRNKKSTSAMPIPRDSDSDGGFI